MKKVTILSLLIAFTVSLFAQNSVGLYSKRDILEYKQKNINQSKAVGDIIWDNDFSNPADWIITNETGDDQNWVVGTAGPTGYYSAALGILASTTAANGFAMFDSDAVGYGGGLQNAHLTYDGTIDFTGVTSVAVAFTQLYRKWTISQTFVSISNDGGATWSSFECNPGLQDGEMGTDQVVLNVSTAAANQSSVKIRLTYVGDWGYLWEVDDIKIIEGAENDLQIQDFYANSVYTNGGFYSNCPAVHQKWYNFYANAFNNGAQSQTGAYLNVTVTENDIEIYNVDGDAPTTILPGATDSLGIDSVFLPEVDIMDPYKTYKVTFTVNQNETDELISNNIDTLIMFQTDTVMARDYVYSTYTGPGRYSDGTDGDFMGTNFMLFDQDTVSSMSVFIHSTTELGGTSLVPVLYVHDYDIGERFVILEGEEYDIQPEDLGTWVTLPFPYLTSYGEDNVITPDENGTTYIVGCQFYYGDKNLYIGADNVGPHVYDVSTSMYLQSLGAWFYMNNVPMCRLNFHRSNPIGISAETEILTFTLPSQTAPALIDFINHTISIDVTTGTDLSNIIPDITVSEGATIFLATGGVVDFSNGTVLFTVIAENGTQQIWYVTVLEEGALNFEADILSFSLPTQTTSSVIDAINHAVDIEVGFGTDLSTLIPAITLSYGASIDPLSGSTVDFSGGSVNYTVTAENGVEQPWGVTVTVALNTENDILAFSLPQQTEAANINSTNHTANIEVSTGTDLSNLIPSIALSYAATINPTSGSTVDFSGGSVNFIVTAEDETTQTWIVTVTEEIILSSEKEILSFVLTEQTGESDINSTNYTIDIEVELGSDLSSLSPVITVSGGATINPVSGSTVDFSNGSETCVVTAEDGTTQNWIVTVTEETSSKVDIDFNDMISIYPNPSNGIVNIETKAIGNNPTIVEITNIIGSSILNMPIDNNSINKIDLTKQPAGLYLIKVTSGNRTKVEKIVIK